MDPFTQRMLERARARQEKIDQKLANSGQIVPKRKPLAENVGALKSGVSPVKSPTKNARDTVLSPKKTSLSSVKSPNRRSSQKSDQTIASPQRARNDFVVTKKEFKSPRSSKGSINRRNSDVSVEINIMHRNDIQVEVQVEERDAPISVSYESSSDSGSNVTVKEITGDIPRKALKAPSNMEDNKNERSKLSKDVKSRLDRLGNLYSDQPNLSSPIHRTEQQFTSATPPTLDNSRPPLPKPEGKKKFGRLAALADQINNWEDDLSHHTYHPEPTKKAGSKPNPNMKSSTMDSSTLEVSIHSLNDINKVLQTATPKSSQSSKSVNSHTFTKPASINWQKLDKNIVAELEPKGASTTPSAAAAPNMATMVASPPVAVTKKPSIKKYKAPTPPQKSISDEYDSEKDKENNAVQKEENDNVQDNCKQTNDDKPAERGSPVVKKYMPKLNGNVDRNSVLSKAAMFESGSPRAKEKDPAEMSLRERKALFEKNKGTVILPKAPFGLAPSVKSLYGDSRDKPLVAPKPSAPTKTTNLSTTSVTNSSKLTTDSRDYVIDDNISQSSIGGGIKGKLAALLSKEKTISESTIASKFKQEREKEMEMLNNRFNYKPKPEKEQESDDDQSDHDPSEKAPLMGSVTSLQTTNRKPEIIANVPKINFEHKTKSETALNDKETEADKDKVIGSQPVKRRSSQDSPVVLSVLEDVKRIKVNNKKDANGAVLQQPASLYPHLSDIETDNSHPDEYSDCGGSSTEDATGNDKLNKSENWAETSFGREVMNVVKKNNTSYKKAVRESDSDSDGAADSELDELLDEALESEGPTPPKVNKHGSLSSNSFEYQQKSQSQFKSPLKTQSTPQTPAQRVDRGNELVHSVSFYRRMQSASSTPSTPVRVIRHSSPERESSAPEPAVAVTVRQRIKELNNEIAKQQTVISQASQALNLCASTIEFSGSTEQAEGERLLLLATHRRQACLHEVQRLQVEGAGEAATPGMASLTIHSLTVPLRRDYVRQLNADGAVGHHAVCLIKCRDRALATSMHQTRPAAAALHFPDQIRMDHLTSDFKVTVEVYLLQASKEILPHDVKYHINKKSNSKLLTPKSKTSSLKTPGVQSPGGPLAVRSPQFQLHGYCIFALPQANRKTFTLSKVPCGSPLEGSIHLDIKAIVRVPAPAPHSAFLTAFDDVSGLGAWHRRWFRLQAPRLAYWKYPDDVQKKMPIGDIDLTTIISEKVIRAPRDLCARPNTLLLESSVPAGLIVPEGGSLVYVKRSDGSVVRRHLLAADTPKDRDIWLDCLNKALEYVRCCTQDDE